MKTTLASVNSLPKTNQSEHECCLTAANTHDEGNLEAERLESVPHTSPRFGLFALHLAAFELGRKQLPRQVPKKGGDKASHLAAMKGHFRVAQDVHVLGWYR